LIAFDCLYARGKDLWERPLRVRRNVLEELVDGHDLVLPARRLAPDGLAAWAQVVERGYEGLVGKDEASPYVEGRTLSWLKVKVPKYRESERGWDPKRGRDVSRDAEAAGRAQPVLGMNMPREEPKRLGQSSSRSSRPRRRRKRRARTDWKWIVGGGRGMIYALGGHMSRRRRREKLAEYLK
jgi:hypothetical protein